MRENIRLVQHVVHNVVLLEISVLSRHNVDVHIRNCLSCGRSVLDRHRDGIHVVVLLDEANHLPRHQHEIGSLLFGQEVECRDVAARDDENVPGNKGLQIDRAEGEGGGVKDLVGRQ